MKVWPLKEADGKFSNWIRFERDGRCKWPWCPRPQDTSGLQCSHFWGRGIWPLRFEPDNCDAFHEGCHLFKAEKDKQGDYRQFKIDQLGQERYDELEKIAMDYKHGKLKTTHREEIKKLMEFLKNHV